jgi:DNA polymerase-3 subunit alpha
MTMDISNQMKLGEFYEELKRLNINIIRPDINKCFADFRSDDNNFYYALGGVKAVGYMTVSNIVNERIKNGEFKSINDFIKRVKPKDINKLQLEGLVKAGSFDNINSNRYALFNSIPNFILKSKSNFDNKVANQIDLFSSDEIKDEDIVLQIEDWKFEERLSKEFEAIGFFISDHPLNQFKEIFDNYNIIDFNKFNSDKEIKANNIAATLLKIQEKKTQKGNTYAIIKLTDLRSVFELFIFSDVLESNRNLLVEGNSLIITLSKNIAEGENRFKRINVKKISSLKDLFNKPVSEIELKLNHPEQVKEISNILIKEGSTNVKIIINNLDNDLVFQLKNKRLVDRQSLNILKNQGILTTIH